MPVVAKAGGAGGLVLDDVDTGNLPVLVNVHMVVDNHAALAVIELVAVAQLAGDAPDVIDQARGHLQTVLFPVKLGVGGAHHVEQDAKAGVVVALVRVFAPVLTAQGPGVGLVGQVEVVGLTVIFGVEEDDVDAGMGGVLTQLTGNFEQYAYATGAVVGSEDGFIAPGRIGVVVGKGATVPMRIQHNTVAFFWLKLSDNVADLQTGVVEVAQFSGQIVGTGQVGWGVGHAGTKSDLFGHIVVGRVGHEVGRLQVGFGGSGCLFGSTAGTVAGCAGGTLSASAAAGAQQKYGETKGEQADFYGWLHLETDWFLVVFVFGRVLL